VASFVRNSFGNNAGFVTPAQVAAVRKAMGTRRAPWTVTELLPTIPTLLTNSGEWKLTASHNTEAAANAVGATPGARWDSGGPQAAGMWLQVELPQTTTLSEVQIDATAAPAPFGRGRGGPGGAAAGPGGPGPVVARGGAAGAPPQAAAGGGAAGRAGAPAGRGGRGPALPPAVGPIAFRVQVSTDGTSWSAPLIEGAGAATTVMAFKPTPAKFIRITQTGTTTRTEPWGVAQMRIYQAGR
jgi:hypothetical protein